LFLSVNLLYNLQMEKYAVIVAGGSGTRMGTQIPKQFLLLHQKPVLIHSVEAFLQAYIDMHIIVVLPLAFVDKGKQLVQGLPEADRVQIVAGGETRFHSVQQGLSKVLNPSIVFVHDGVRCMVSPQLIINCYNQALEKGSAIPAIAVTDSIRMNTGYATKPLDRNLLRAIQTPQTFRSDIILHAFEQPYNEQFTDEATVVEASGQHVYLIEGEKENIKITLPADISIAEIYLKSRNKSIG
jgi:2-C-methyl-D-erythritol 4-phosphate cytidylyltransferase